MVAGPGGCVLCALSAEDYERLLKEHHTDVLFISHTKKMKFLMETRCISVLEIPYLVQLAYFLRFEVRCEYRLTSLSHTRTQQILVASKLLSMVSRV